MGRVQTKDTDDERQSFRRRDPARQDSHLDLQQLVSAIYATGVMATTPTGEVGADIELHQLAPLFFTLARAGERIIEDLVDSFPTRPSSRRAARAKIAELRGPVSPFVNPGAC